jgi:hypothetical protein
LWFAAANAKTTRTRFQLSRRLVVHIPLLHDERAERLVQAAASRKRDRRPPVALAGRRLAVHTYADAASRPARAPLDTRWWR